MTLLELVLVMFLMALILGSGLGLFAALDLGRRQAASTVRNVLRSAQNTAIASGAPARVRIDKQQGTLRGESMLVVGTYHFEQRRLTGYGPDGKAEPELYDDEGFVGDCFHPAGKLGATAEIPIGEDSAFDFTLGFALECALWRDVEAGGRVLSVGAREPFTLVLDLSPGGALRASFRSRLGDETSERPGDKVLLTSEPGLVPVRRWTQVRVQYDRASFELLVDGTRVASREEDACVWKIDGPLTLSDRMLPFPGKIDSLVIGAMVAGEPGRLPETVHFGADTSARIEFAAGGGLNRRLHSDPPRIVLEFQDGSRETIAVGFYGTVE